MDSYLRRLFIGLRSSMKKIELLSPAGDLERLKVTLLYGADAVYLGGEKYGLRANATNFTIDEIREGCSFAHRLGKKVYLTLNIVFHNEDMDGVTDYIGSVVDAGIDAFIVSDPFIISYIKSNCPNVEVHLSTQNSWQDFLLPKRLSDAAKVLLLLPVPHRLSQTPSLPCLKYLGLH